MRVQTIRQPWAWAVAIGAKRVENRTQNTRYRGRLGIHAGKEWSHRGMFDPRMRALVDEVVEKYPKHRYTIRHGVSYRNVPPFPFVASAIIAVAELVDCHPAMVDCCGPWGETEYLAADGTWRTNIWHEVLADIMPIDPYISCGGRLGLWVPDHELAAQVELVLST